MSKSAATADSGGRVHQIAAATGLGSPALDEAIDCLERHDMIIADVAGDDGVKRWRCTVELMRRWLSQQPE